jgi:hypothetical protein
MTRRAQQRLLGFRTFPLKYPNSDPRGSATYSSRHVHNVGGRAKFVRDTETSYRSFSGMKTPRSFVRLMVAHMRQSSRRHVMVRETRRSTLMRPQPRPSATLIYRGPPYLLRQQVPRDLIYPSAHSLHLWKIKGSISSSIII